MNIEDIKEFTDVVAYSSISEAARRNHLSQQTLSRRIINLEKELGQRIFDRSTTLTLTPVGKVFLRYAHEILSITQEMQAEVDAIASSTQSVITVKRYPTDSFFRVLAGAIESMQEFCPNVKFEFTSKNQDDRELVIEGLIDIGFSREIVFEGASPCIEDDEIACMPLVSNSFPLIFGVPENHPILHIANPTLSDIASFKIAIPSFANKGALPNAVRDLFQKKQLPLRIDMVYSQSMLEYYAAVSRDS
ncbi:MAG: LysR family transcriptional regulator, partial [Raoultibacter sp.]